MKYNLNWIIKQKGYFNFDEQLQFQPEMFDNFAQINDLKNVEVSGNADYNDRDKRLYVEMNIKGTMILPCAKTLEDVDYPFDITSTEVFAFTKPEEDEDVHFVKKDIVDLTPVIFSNIMVEVPMRVVKEGAKMLESGKGWKVLDEDEQNKEDEEYIDPRLAKLKDYFKQED